MASPEPLGRTASVGPEPRDGPWTLTVGGLAATRLELTLAQLEALGPRESATGGPECPEGFGTNGFAFAGVPLLAIVELANADPSATHVSVESGPFIASFSLAGLRRQGAVLATHRNGEPIPWEGGGPIRLVPASGGCFNSVKWVERISLDPDGSRANALEFVKARRAQA